MLLNRVFYVFIVVDIYMIYLNSFVDGIRIKHNITNQVTAFVCGIFNFLQNKIKFDIYDQSKSTVATVLF